MTRRWLTGLLVCPLLFSISTARAATVHVSKAAAGTVHDGASWSTAFTTIRQGMNAAHAGDEVWVAEGVYPERVDLKKGVGLYGGFVGTEAARDGRSPGHASILDGKGLNTNLVSIPLGATADTVVDGFTLQNGTGVLLNGVARGGGIYCRDASPVISNNIFTANATTQGGGIYCSGAASPRITDNTFTANKAMNGAAIFAAPGATPFIARNRMTGNISDFGNVGPDGITPNAVVTLSAAGGEVRDNVIGDSTGLAGLTMHNASPVVAGNLFARNTSDSNGGGIFAVGGAPVITGNRFEGNTARRVSGSLPSMGGGLYWYGANLPGAARIANNVFVGNSAEAGAAMALSNGNAAVVNNTIVANSGTLCGGIYTPDFGASSAHLTLANNLVAFNAGFGVMRAATGEFTLRANLVYGNTGAAADPNYSGVATGAGDISADPKLLGIGYGDIHIAPDSPAVDAGGNADADGIATDMDGQPRIQGARVDIGADESDGAPFVAAPPVVRVSPAGDDANDGATWATAKKTIQAALDATAAGGEVWVAQGVYTETLTAGLFQNLYGGFGGTETSRGERPGGGRSVLRGASQSKPAVTVAPNAYRFAGLDGFIVENAGQYDNGLGVSGAGMAAPDLRHNVFRHTSGVQLTGPADVRGNVFFANAAPAGKAVLDVGPGAVVVNNTVAANSAPTTAVVRVGAAARVANNIIAFNQSGLTAGEGATVRNNGFYQNVLYDYDGEDLTGTDGNLRADPLFANWRSGDLHIQPSSPCVDAGDAAAADAQGTDMDGGPRIVGAAVDIGADESDGTVWNVPPVVVRVSPGGSDVNDGSSWANAMRTIGAALQRIPNGGEVWAAAGAYAEHVDLDTLQAIYGGFAGTEERREDRSGSDVSSLAWSTSTTTDSVVSTNTGAMFCRVDGFHIGSPTLNGVSLQKSAYAEVTNNRISEASTGVVLGSGSQTLIEGNAIAGNRGNGIQGAWSSPTRPGEIDVRIRDNRIQDNGSSGVFLGESSAIERNVLSGNQASAVQFTATQPSSRLILTDNLIVGNGTAQTPGAVRVSGTALVANNTIVGNSSGGGDYGSAGLWLLQPGPHQQVVNNIIAFNTTGVGQGFPEANGAVLRNNDVFGNAGFNYTNMTDPTGTAGNIAADPLFEDRFGGDFHVRSASPAVDAGDDSVVSPGVVDLAGAPRIQGARVDMGAYETLRRPAFGDAYLALRAAAGLEALSPGDQGRLDVEQSGQSAGVVNLLDALALLRSAAGAG